MKSPHKPERAQSSGNGAAAHTTEGRKQAAVRFLELVVAGRIDDAYREHVDMRGRHHHALVPAGFPALRQAMIDAHAQFPNKQFAVKHVLGDGELVAVHSQIVLSPGGQSMAAVHLFRFQDDKIVELWDIGQPVPADSPNQAGVF